MRNHNICNPRFFRSLIKRAVILLTFMSCHALSADAIDWSDNSISWSYGTKFKEPFNHQDISKNTFSLTHVDGYTYGTNFINADFLRSDSSDPLRENSSAGAMELYVVYRHTLDVGKISGSNLKFGPIRGLGVTAGFDFNLKEDADYNSRKRMLVLGPTLMVDVPGYLNVSLLALRESNNPSTSSGGFDPGYPGHRYYYDTHPMIETVWGIPLGTLPLSFEGYANFIAAKGKDEIGHQTAPETEIDMRVMYDLSTAMGSEKHSFRAGLEYQYWRNKFGNSDSTVGALGGNFARTPMVRVEFHF